MAACVNLIIIPVPFSQNDRFKSIDSSEVILVKAHIFFKNIYLAHHYLHASMQYVALFKHYVIHLLCKHFVCTTYLSLNLNLKNQNQCKW